MLEWVTISPYFMSSPTLPPIFLSPLFSLTVFRSHSSLRLFLFQFWSLKLLCLMIYTSQPHAGLILLFGKFSSCYLHLCCSFFLFPILFPLSLSISPLIHTVHWVAGSDLSLYATCKADLPCSQTQRRLLLLLLWRVTVAAKWHIQKTLPVSHFQIKLNISLKHFYKSMTKVKFQSTSQQSSTYLCVLCS